MQQERPVRGACCRPSTPCPCPCTIARVVTQASQPLRNPASRRPTEPLLRSVVWRGRGRPATRFDAAARPDKTACRLQRALVCSARSPATERLHSTCVPARARAHQQPASSARGLLVASLRFAPVQGKGRHMAGGGGGRDLPSTPTWAVALVCAVIVLVSVAMEHGLHKLGHVRRSLVAMHGAYAHELMVSLCVCV